MIHIITGGSGSGKSAYAEDKILSFMGKQRIYIATMYPLDQESHEKIARHRVLRNDKEFETIECFTGLSEVEIPEDSLVLLECMSNLVANEMYQPGGAKEKAVEAILKGVEVLERKAKEMVIVTNEIFSDSSFYHQETLVYQGYLARINQELAKKAVEVIQVVYGIPVTLKGENHETNLL